MTVGRGTVEEKGPDLGLLILPPVEVSRIPAGKQFYDLGLHADRSLANPPAQDLGLWILCGVAWMNGPLTRCRRGDTSG